jgi:hypothetical protein
MSRRFLLLLVTLNALFLVASICAAWLVYSSGSLPQSLPQLRIESEAITKMVAGYDQALRGTVSLLHTLCAFATLTAAINVALLLIGSRKHARDAETRSV